MFFFLLGLLLAPAPAEANTQVIFNREGNQATVMLMGMPGDSDPFGFWNALNIPPEDFQGKLNKRLAVNDPAGGATRPFDAVCVFSKMIANNGTCTLIFRSVEGSGLVNRAAGQARLLLTGEQAELVAKAFVIPAETNFVFRSRDGKLQVSVVKEDDGRVSWLVVDWNGKGIF